MVSVENTGFGNLNLRFGVTLVPGVNPIEPEDWDKCRDDKLTKHYLSINRVRVVSGSTALPTSKPKAPVPLTRKAEPAPPPPADDEPVSLSDMKAKEAKAWVSSCLDYDVLESALLDEKRSSVVTAIEDRLGALGDED